MSKYTLWVIFGPLALASTDWAQKNAATVTRINAKITRLNIVAISKGIKESWIRRRGEHRINAMYTIVRKSRLNFLQMDDDLILNLATDDFSSPTKASQGKKGGRWTDRFVFKNIF